MRGVVSLAAALALPTVLKDGSPFPQRELIICLTFCVILVTLVLQGLTLPPLIRLLGVAGAEGPDCEELEARRIVARAALDQLESAKERDSKDSAEIYDDLVKHYQHRLATLKVDANPKDIEVSEHHRALYLEGLGVERATAIRLRNEGRIGDNVLRRIERELDLEESGLARQEE
jgi:CPA1 family monovalent cation:H+ antiporter